MEPRHATARVGAAPYVVERHVLAGIPCLIERPLAAPRGLVLVYHGVTASKEGNLGVFTPLIRAGLAVVLPDAVGHGERREATLSSEALGYRNYLRLCAAKTALEAHALIDALQAQFTPLPTAAIGISMGGYVAQYLALREKRVQRIVVISSGGAWHETEVSVPLARDFIEAHRPARHAHLAPPTRLLLLHGDADPVFPLPDFQVTESAYRAAYQRVGLADHFTARLYPGVEHYTTSEMRDAAVEWLSALADHPPAHCAPQQP